MAVKANVTTDPEGSSSKLYVGVAAFKVTHVNPTLEQLKALGFKKDKPPVYTDEKHGNRVVFFIEATAPGGDKIRSNVSFFIKPHKKETIFINKLFRFDKDRANLSGDIRNPYDGEIELLSFIQAWANVPKDQELCIDTIDRLALTGDVSEIRQIHNTCKDGYFKALCTVGDGKYQRVFNKKFERGFCKDFSYLHKSLVAHWNYIKDDLGGIDKALYIRSEFELRPWSGVTATLAASAQHSSNGNGSHVEPLSGSNSEDDDDLPF
jgi:hypothetical protein